MQQLNVVYLRETGDNESLDFSLFVKASYHKMRYTPWSSGEYKPQVSFCIAHSGRKIFLKYVVSERHIRAVNTAVNSPVYEDSCVEFFISFDGDESYYNFEFNCIGTCLAGFGNGRTERKEIRKELLGMIASEARIKKKREGEVSWELNLILPIEVFSEHQLNSLNGRRCRANFYKCGDKLPDPHFVSWTEIKSAEPDFHLPAFFGEIVFE